MASIAIHQTSVLWCEFTNPPDADIEILIGRTDGEVVIGYYDDELGEFCNSYGLPMDAKWWAHMPEPPQ